MIAALIRGFTLGADLAAVFHRKSEPQVITYRASDLEAVQTVIGHAVALLWAVEKYEEWEIPDAVLVAASGLRDVVNEHVQIT